MTKVDLDLLRKVQEIQHKTWEIQGKTLEILAEYQYFCDRCGETEPEGGFYPLWAHGPGSISGLTCNPCINLFDAENKQREEKKNGL